jgi:hypothetical protein
MQELKPEDSQFVFDFDRVERTRAGNSSMQSINANGLVFEDLESP